MFFTDFLKKRKAEEANTAAKRAAEIKKASEKLQQIQAEMRSAATAGNMEKYNKLDNELRTLKNNLYVMGEAINEQALSETETVEAWKLFVIDYNDTFRAQYKKYTEAKVNLYKELKGLAEIQNQGLRELIDCPKSIKDAGADLMKLEPQEAKGAVNLLNDIAGYREAENLKMVFGGAYVNDISKDLTLAEFLTEVSKKKTAEIKAQQAEAQKRRDILEDYWRGKVGIDAIYWEDLEGKSEKEVRKFMSEKYYPLHDGRNFFN